MPTFIQLNNNVGYAVIHASGEVDHTVTPDHITAIEYDGENPEQFLKKKYDPSTKTWSDAPLYVWCEVNEEGRIMEIRRTYFENEINGPIMTEDVRPDSKWVNGAWVAAPVIEYISQPMSDPSEGAGQPSLEQNEG